MSHLWARASEPSRPSSPEVSATYGSQISWCKYEQFCLNSSSCWTLQVRVYFRCHFFVMCSCYGQESLRKIQVKACTLWKLEFRTNWTIFMKCFTWYMISNHSLMFYLVKCWLFISLYWSNFNSNWTLVAWASTNMSSPWMVTASGLNGNSSLETLRKVILFSYI